MKELSYLLLAMFTFVLTLFLVDMVNAATLETQWQPYEQAPNEMVADGFKIYQVTGDNSAVVVWENTDLAATSAQFEYEDTANCGTFYLVAYRGTIESPPSNTAVWCPKYRIPAIEARPGQTIEFKIQVVN